MWLLESTGYPVRFNSKSLRKIGFTLSIAVIKTVDSPVHANIHYSIEEIGLSHHRDCLSDLHKR